MSEYDIVIDSNEASVNERLVNDLKEAGFKVAIQHLEAGDIFFKGQKIDELIERKTTRDFAKSVLDDRLWNQLTKLKMKQEELGCRIAILIEGSWYDVVRWTSWNRASIVGIMDSIRDPDGWGIEIIGPFPGKIWTSLWLTRRARKNKGIDAKTMHALRRPLSGIHTDDELRRYLVEGLTGIGPLAADRLLRHFGSVASVFANIERLDEVRRVGKITVKKNLDIVTGKYKQ